MNINFNDIVPIYIQIADAIEDDILSGQLKPGEPCYSQVVIAKELSINPATAGKGIRLLVERNVLEKVRGQAMSIKPDAIDTIRKRRTQDEMQDMVAALVREARKLDITKDSLLQTVAKTYDKMICGADH